MTGPADAGPPVPAPAGAPARGVPLTTRQHLRGHYAGFASRFISFVFDCAISIGVFELTLVAASFAASVLAGTSIHWSRGNIWVILGFFAWEFFYYAYFWTASGKTPGMVLLGVQVVGEEGGQAGTRRGLIRALAFPLSFILVGSASWVSCSGVIAARCTTSSPAPRSSTAGTRGKRGSGPSPVAAARGARREVNAPGQPADRKRANGSPRSRPGWVCVSGAVVVYADWDQGDSGDPGSSGAGPGAGSVWAWVGADCS